MSIEYSDERLGVPQFLSVGNETLQPRAEWQLSQIDHVDGIDLFVPIHCEPIHRYIREWVSSSMPLKSLTLQATGGLDAEQIHNVLSAVGAKESWPKTVIIALFNPLAEEELAYLDTLAAKLADWTAVLIEPRYEVNLVEILDLLDTYTNLGLSANIQLLSRQEYDVSFALTAAANYIRFVRVADINGWAPGLGVLQWDSICRALTTITGLQAISLDMAWRPNLAFAVDRAQTTLEAVTNHTVATS